MPETIILDPSEVATDRVELDINNASGGIVVREGGIDWGNAEIAAYMAEQERGEAPIDFRIPNRQVSIPLRISAGGTATFDQNRAKLQKKVALFQREGGYVKRVISNGGTVFADVVNASLTMPGDWFQAARSIQTEVQLNLETIPDFYENEITLSSHAESSAAELRFTETGLRGDSPARVRVEVTEAQAQNQGGVVWAFRSRNYSSATTNALAYEAESLHTHDSAVKTAITGASGGTVVSHSSLGVDWTPVVGSNIAGTQFMTHIGTHRLVVRCRSANAGSVDLRAVWDVGDLLNPVENDPVTVPAGWGTALGILDLGELNLQKIVAGTHRHQFQIQGRGAAGGENVGVDRVWIVPSDEGMGMLRAVDNPTVFDTFSARDPLDPTGTVALTGQVLSVGGTWISRTLNDTDDFDGLAALSYYFRSDVSDTGTGFAGRAVLAGTAVYASIVAGIDLFFDRPDLMVGKAGLTLRDQNSTTSALRVLVEPLASASNAWIQVYSGTTIVAYAPFGFIQSSAFYSLRAQVLANGTYAVWFNRQDARFGDPILSGWRPELVTGGSLASGRVGIYDENTTASASTRGYQNFYAYVPGVSGNIGDAVIFASRKAQLRTDGHFRQDTGGSAYGPVSDVVGPLPRIPVAGIEGRTTEVFIKATRGNLGDQPDPGIDDISAQVYYRPSWLHLPD